MTDCEKLAEAVRLEENRWFEEKVCRSGLEAKRVDCDRDSLECQADVNVVCRLSCRSRRRIEDESKRKFLLEGFRSSEKEEGKEEVISIRG